MTRRQKRMTVVVVVLALLLAVLLAYFAYYRTTKKLTFDLSAPVSGVVSTPEYLYSFSGADKNRMQRPIGVLADGGEVFVADGERRDIAVFKPDGTPLRSFGASETAIPLYIAKNPLDGVLYVTDRRLRTIHKFTRDGKYLGDFAPNLPENVKPNFDTGGVEWAPVALDFAPDGKLYVVELLGGHRLIIFDPKGRFVKAVGTTGFVTDDDAEGIDVFQFPNSVKVRGDSVYIVDSNNRRVQVYSLDGIYQRTIVTQGLPRGLDFLKPFSSDEPSSTARMVIVDTLAHDGTIWTDGGEKILNFGEQGVLEGQFSYPNDVSIDDSNRIFISDTANGRIQVWGWPEIVSPVPVPRGPALWGCFAPLLLLPLALFFRKRKFLATPEFVEMMIEIDAAASMPSRRRSWWALEAHYEPHITSLVADDVDFAELFHSIEYSESDVTALMQKLDIDHDTAAVLTVAKRMRVFCTESSELRRFAKVLEIDVVDANEFVSRFTKASRNATDSGAQ